MPGAPAQALPIDGYVLVTIRDPGLLLILKEEPGNKLKETARIPLSADAWGLAITKDEKTVIVTSAWTHTVTAVELGTKKVLWALDVAREPRGIVIHPNGKTAYISHLTSGDLTRIDDVASTAAKASTVAFPAAPARTPQGLSLPASLGYALVMDDAGNRLLAARHALGALGENAWFGAPTVDVLQTQNDKPLLGPRVPDKRLKTTPAYDETRAWALKTLPAEDYQRRQFATPVLSQAGLSQPRAMVVAHKSQTVWLASEGDDKVAELPLLAAAPVEVPVRSVHVGSHYRDPKIIVSYARENDEEGIAGHCGAPTGLALNVEETFLYVFCRSTYDIATVGLSAGYGMTVARVANDPMDESVSRGRRLFYSALDRESSGGMGCAGCHPEGRDDGHVWHDVHAFPDAKSKEAPIFLASKNLAPSTFGGKLGYPRQTPMLAGRVNARGPYGWHAQSATLDERLAEGFGRHRWFGTTVDPKKWIVAERAIALQAFLRQALPPPPRLDRELTEEEKKGKQLFESPATQCTRCHVPQTEFTDRTAYPLPKRSSPPGFEDEAEDKFKTPSLLFVGGTPPYYHDGHAPTLEALISQNADRMGRTSQLTAGEKAALVAYLKTL